jgi:hypothetical protein
VSNSLCCPLPQVASKEMAYCLLITPLLSSSPDGYFGQAIPEMTTWLEEYLCMPSVRLDQESGLSIRIVIPQSRLLWILPLLLDRLDPQLCKISIVAITS